MRRQSAPRLEFEAAAIYEYPEHLRPWLEALPRQPGVYLFHGESDTLPLYIGKSVNIRSRNILRGIFRCQHFSVCIYNVPANDSLSLWNREVHCGSTLVTMVSTL